MQLSVVIICKNGSAYLQAILKSVSHLANEVLVYDTGSCDNSKIIACCFDVRFIDGEWEGYGKTRYKAALLAKYDWILMLDTDEVPDEELQQSIAEIDLSVENFVYNIRYKNFFGKKHIKHGEWGNDSHIRLVNRKTVSTDEETVHEKLFLQGDVIVKTLKGYIHHYTANNTICYVRKMTEYAYLAAEKYWRSGRRATLLKIYLSPLFSFLKNYFFKLGFLDGREGFICAGVSAWYTFLKYAQLREFNRVTSTEYEEVSENYFGSHPFPS